MTARTTLSKRDANTLAADGADVAQDGPLKKPKKETGPPEDEFDKSDQEFDDEALIAAAEEAESAASNLASSQPNPSSSQAEPVPSTSSETTASIESTPKASATSNPRSTLRQATLFPSSSKASSSSSSVPTESLPKLQPPSDISSDPLWLEHQTMSPSWFTLLRPEMEKPYFSTTLKNFLAAEDKAGKKTYPPRELIYSWSRLVPTPRHVRVVVVGQDPYHGPGQACGLSFAVPKGIAVPPSLRNIYKELATEYPSSFTPPKHGCLDGWARQGVLMLNACLTVSAGAAASHHGKGWEGLTKHILKKIADEAAGSSAAKKANANATANSKIASMFAKVQGKPATSSVDGNDASTDSKEAKEGEETQCKGIVFLVWGAPAAKTLTEAGVTEKNPNILILKSPHPSPLSAHRGFLGNGHFKKANEWLKQRYGEEGMIDWSQL